MPQLKVLRLNKPLVSSPQVIQDNSAESLFVGISQELNNLAQQEIQAYADQTIGEATELGAIEGFAGKGARVEAQKRPGFSLSAQAYNEAAKKSASVRLELEYTNALEDIKRLNIANPSGYESSVNSYINGFVDELGRNPLTKDSAPLFEKKLKFKQLSDSSVITETYNNLVKDRYEADVLLLTDSIKTNAYRYAKNVFSDNPEDTLRSLQNYKLSLQELSNNLNSILPNGKAAFSQESKVKQLQAFSESFFTYGMEDVIDTYSNNYVQEIPGSKYLTIDMIDELKSGILINIPGTEFNIDVLKEVGADNYDKIVKYAESKLTSQQLARERKERLLPESQKKLQRENDVAILNSLLSKKPINGVIPTPDYIMNLLTNGAMSKAGAEEAIKYYYNDEIAEDDILYAQLSANVTMGNTDERDVIVRNATRLGEKRFNDLYTQAQKNVTQKIKTEETENLQTIYKEAVDKTLLNIELTSSIVRANDFMQQYKQLVKGYLEYPYDSNGNIDYSQEPKKIQYSPKVALEIVRQNILSIKRDSINQPSRIPVFFSVDKTGKLDLNQAARFLKRSAIEGIITGDELEAEYRKIMFMQQEESSNQISTNENKSK
jgi:hypothetical protein